MDQGCARAIFNLLASAVHKRKCQSERERQVLAAAEAGRRVYKAGSRRAPGTVLRQREESKMAAVQRSAGITAVLVILAMASGAEALAVNEDPPKSANFEKLPKFERSLEIFPPFLSLSSLMAAFGRVECSSASSSLPVGFHPNPHCRFREADWLIGNGIWLPIAGDGKCLVQEVPLIRNLHERRFGIGQKPAYLEEVPSLGSAFYKRTDPSRQSGFVYLTPERRLTLPPESVLVLTPTLSLPMGRNLPFGYGASMTISIPFKILASSAAPTATPFFFRDAPVLCLRFVNLLLTFRSSLRPFLVYLSSSPPGTMSSENTWGIIEGLDDPSPGDLAGGHREVMYKVVEESLQSVGLDGKACLLRAICEMFELPLPNYGFIGELLDLFFSASRSANGKIRLWDYTKAELRSKGGQDCTPYHEACPYSFFEAPARSNSTGVGGSE
ncbi:hypothetical protein C7M84_018328 [Penaeus vannamei]|uniref:Uncharacterized protein n=1 Tax=Penaeus vannamei TaxID=6689 RepID=A0A423SHQ1_PENVA|nr:hypothetical protein C7M84_018328 [Penaeus vannamei]